MTAQEYLGRVRSLLPALRERAAHTEQLRRLPDETFKDFQSLGLFRCLQPRRYEGYELDPVTFYQAIMEVGAVCGSSAWVLGVVGVHNWHLALFPPQAQADVWGDDTSVQLSTSLAPTGTVERTITSVSGPQRSATWRAAARRLSSSGAWVTGFAGVETQISTASSPLAGSEAPTWRRSPWKAARSSATPGSKRCARPSASEARTAGEASTPWTVKPLRASVTAMVRPT